MKPVKLHVVQSDPLWSSSTLEDLAQLSERLRRAQDEENETIVKLNALTITTQANTLEFDKVMEEAREARARAQQAYEAWDKTIRSLNRSGG